MIFSIDMNARDPKVHLVNGGLVFDCRLAEILDEFDTESVCAGGWDQFNILVSY